MRGKGEVKELLILYRKNGLKVKNMYLRKWVVGYFTVTVIVINSNEI